MASPQTSNPGPDGKLIIDHKPDNRRAWTAAKDVKAGSEKEIIQAALGEYNEKNGTNFAFRQKNGFLQIYDGEKAINPRQQAELNGVIAGIDPVGINSGNAGGHSGYDSMDPHKTDKRRPWVAARDVKPGSEKAVIQAALGKYNEENGTNFDFRQKNGTLQIYDGRKAINPKQERELNGIIAGIDPSSVEGRAGESTTGASDTESLVPPGSTIESGSNSPGGPDSIVNDAVGATDRLYGLLPPEDQREVDVGRRGGTGRTEENITGVSGTGGTLIGMAPPVVAVSLTDNQIFTQKEAKVARAKEAIRVKQQASGQQAGPITPGGVAPPVVAVSLTDSELRIQEQLKAIRVEQASDRLATSFTSRGIAAAAQNELAEIREEEKKAGAEERITGVPSGGGGTAIAAGLPGLTDGQLLTQEELKAIRVEQASDRQAGSFTSKGKAIAEGRANAEERITGVPSGGGGTILAPPVTGGGTFNSGALNRGEEVGAVITGEIKPPAAAGGNVREFIPDYGTSTAAPPAVERRRPPRRRGRGMTTNSLM